MESQSPHLLKIREKFFNLPGSSSLSSRGSVILSKVVCQIHLLALSCGHVVLALSRKLQEAFLIYCLHVPTPTDWSGSKSSGGDEWLFAANEVGSVHSERVWEYLLWLLPLSSGKVACLLWRVPRGLPLACRSRVTGRLIISY